MAFRVSCIVIFFWYGFIYLAEVFYSSLENFPCALHCSIYYFSSAAFLLLSVSLAIEFIYTFVILLSGDDDSTGVAKRSLFFLPPKAENKPTGGGLDYELVISGLKVHSSRLLSRFFSFSSRICCLFSSLRRESLKRSMNLPGPDFSESPPWEEMDWASAFRLLGFERYDRAKFGLKVHSFSLIRS